MRVPRHLQPFAPGLRLAASLLEHFRDGRLRATSTVQRNWRAGSAKSTLQRLLGIRRQLAGPCDERIDERGRGFLKQGLEHHRREPGWRMQNA